MPYNVLNVKQDLTGILHGTTLNQITNLDGLIYRAARQVLLDVDPQETKRIVQFSTPIFNDVFSYALASDVKGNKIFDIRPQVNRTGADQFNQDYSKQFDLSKTFSLQDQFNINFNTSVKTILVNAPLLPQGITVNQAAGTTLNGTWTVGGGATALTTNNTNYLAGGGALQLNLAAGQASGYVEVSDMDTVDLTNHLNQATEFLWTYLPTASSVTSVSLRWGSSAANYYTSTATVTQANTAFQNGYNQLAYVWKNATTVGTPDVTNITYLRVTWNYNSTLQTGVLLNDIVSQLGQIMEYGYYSKYMFRDAITGAYQETVTDDSNLVNLDTESYDLLFNQVAYLAVQQQQGKNALQMDAKFFLDKYTADVIRYKGMYKSEVQKPTQIYYRQPNPRYNQYTNRFIN